MARQKISRNDPCPCRSGKKYKHCCYSKDIDWSERAAAARRPKLPRVLADARAVLHGPFHVVDSKLKSIAKQHPGSAAWKKLVEGLSTSTTTADRMKTYKAVREARVLPEEAAEYLILWAIQWLPGEVGTSALGEPDEDDLDEEAANQELDRETLVQLRKFGVADLAELFVSNRLEFDRRHERGRQFFYGPPEEELARHLKSKGIID